MTTLANLVTEKDLQTQVLELARLYGWRSYHTFDSRRSEPGFPDLALVRGGRLILAELKRESGRVTPAQRAWLDALENCRTVEVYVWRPSDRDAVARTLAAAEPEGTVNE